MAKANSKGMLPNGRSGRKAQFTMALHVIFDHPDYVALSKPARALLWDVSRQFNGRNNGNLCCAEGTMSPYGYSKASLSRLRSELVSRDWLRVTRSPRWPREPYLYALSWLPVDKFDEPELDDGARSKPRRALS